MDWLDKEIAEQWRAEGKRYASEINEYVRIGTETDWSEDIHEPEEDQRRTIASQVVAMIRAANSAGEYAKLREQLPPASWPITSEFKEQLQGVKPLAYLTDGSLLVQAGGLHGKSTVYILHDGTLTVVSDASYAGGSADGSYVALVDEQGIRVVKGMTATATGEQTAAYRWKDVQMTLKAALSDMASLADEEHPDRIIEEVIPFEGGKRVLLVSSYGIYLLSDEGEAELLHPELSDLQEYEAEDTYIDMAHGDVSPDGRWLAYGAQSSTHMLRDMQSGKVYEFEPISSYPHFARFSKDGEEVWYNSCHFYNGGTFKVLLEQAEQGKLDSSSEDGPTMNEEMRVYAAAALENGHILGDAYGYLKLIDKEGREIWRYFVGSTISGMKAAADGSMLAVGTYGGMLHLLKLDSGEKSEYSIGTADILEIDRWILWQKQEPLRW